MAGVGTDIYTNKKENIRMGVADFVMADRKRIKIRSKIRHYIFGILYMLAVCMITTGCTVSLPAEQNTVSEQDYDQISFFEEPTDVKMPENNEKAKYPLSGEFVGSGD